jgi:hypothetical protein
MNVRKVVLDSLAIFAANKSFFQQIADKQIVVSDSVSLIEINK